MYVFMTIVPKRKEGRKQATLEGRTTAGSGN